MTITPKSVGISAGVKGARISANSSGRVTRTVGIPGTGISHVSTSSTRTPARNSRVPASAARPSAAPPSPPTPGLLSPKWEKELHKAAATTAGADALASIGARYEQARPTTALLEALQRAPAGDNQRTIALLSWLQGTGYDPERDAFLRKYFPYATVSLKIADEITVQSPLTNDFIGLLLAESYQAEGDLQSAANVVEQLEPTTITAVSLAELYIDQGRWGDVVELTDGLTNQDDFSTYLLIQRGIAFREQGFTDAARDSLKEALRVRSRPADLRHRALIERGVTFLQDGKRSLAKKDFEKVLAENSTYPGLQEHLAQFKE